MGDGLKDDYVKTLVPLVVRFFRKGNEVAVDNNLKQSYDSATASHKTFIRQSRMSVSNSVWRILQWITNHTCRL
jgi:hypothetical protein